MSDSWFNYGFCSKHMLVYTTPICLHCAAEQPADVLRMRLDVQSQTIEVLMSRIDGLSRRLMRAEQALADQAEDFAARLDRLNEAHNDLVVYAEQIEQLIARHIGTEARS